MLLDFALPAHERKLIPEGRSAGPMPWIIGIMIFLTLLAAASGLLIASAAQAGGEDLSRSITIQIIEADPAQRASDSASVARILRQQSSVVAVEPVAETKVRELLKPWLGDGVIDADIPVPALIDVKLASTPDKAMLQQIEQKLARAGASTRIDSHAAWMAPFFDLMRTLVWVALGILLLLMIATSTIVALAVRSALNTHRQTIDIMHMMGSTDIQVARLFQRRVALDALLGGIIGFAGATIVIILLSGRFGAVEPGLLSGTAMPWYGWIVLALIPLAVTGLAMLMARWTVVSALKKML